VGGKEVESGTLSAFRFLEGGCFVAFGALAGIAFLAATFLAGVFLAVAFLAGALRLGFDGVSWIASESISTSSSRGLPLLDIGALERGLFLFEGVGLLRGLLGLIGRHLRGERRLVIAECESLKGKTLTQPY